MMRRRLGAVLLVWALASVAVLGQAWADDASTYQQKGMTAFALSRYAEAAENFEKAFELNGDPALLYNAAQAHRLAGNKVRALALYENYLRVYGKKEKRVEVETRIEELKKAIENDRAVATKPPNETEPPATAPVTPIPPPPESKSQPLPVSPDPGSASNSSAPVLVAQPAPSDERPLTKSPWFWAAVGGGVVVAALVVVLLVTGGSEDPSPSIGMVDAR